MRLMRLRTKVVEVKTITNPGRSTPCLTCVRNLDECREKSLGKKYKTTDPDCYIAASKSQPGRMITKSKRQPSQPAPVMA